MFRSYWNIFSLHCVSQLQIFSKFTISNVLPGFLTTQRNRAEFLISVSASRPTFHMTNEADAIASIVLKEFQGLPKKRKPQVRDNGIQEWVPLSGIVAKHKDGSFKCLALAYVLNISYFVCDTSGLGHETSLPLNNKHVSASGGASSRYILPTIKILGPTLTT